MLSKFSTENHMTKPALTKFLQSIGINDKESLAYITLLGLGPTSVLKISRESGIKRTSLYSILDSLKEKGLVTEQERGFKKYYVAESPEKLETVIEEAALGLRKFLPDLRSLHQSKSQLASARYVVGLKAIKTCYLEMLKVGEKGKDYLIISNMAATSKIDPAFFDSFIKRRANYGFKIRALFTDTPQARRHQAKQDSMKMSIRLLPEKTTFESNIVIVPKRVLLHQVYPNQVGVVIDNSNLAYALKEIFEIVWGGG